MNLLARNRTPARWRLSGVRFFRGYGAGGLAALSIREDLRRTGSFGAGRFSRVARSTVSFASWLMSFGRFIVPVKSIQLRQDALDVVPDLVHEGDDPLAMFVHAANPHACGEKRTRNRHH